MDYSIEPSLRLSIMLSPRGLIDDGDAASLSFFSARPDIIEHADRMLASAENLSRHIWVGGPDWFEVTIVRELAGAVATVMIQVERIDPPFGLTLRELDVLTLVASGLGNPEIAEMLDIGVRTVTKHVENIFAKTGNWSRAGAAGMAADKGLLRIPQPGPRGSKQQPINLSGVPLAPGIDRRADQPPLVVGLLAEQNHGSGTRNGAALAIGDINASGGLAGTMLELAELDYRVGESKLAKRLGAEVARLDVAAILQTGVLSRDLQGFLEDTVPCTVFVGEPRPTFFSGDNMFQIRPADSATGHGLFRFLTSWQAGAPRRIAIVGTEAAFAAYCLRQQASKLLGMGCHVTFLEAEERSLASWKSLGRRIGHQSNKSAVVLATAKATHVAAFQSGFQFSSADTAFITFVEPSGDVALPSDSFHIMAGGPSGTAAQEFQTRYTAAHGVASPPLAAYAAYDCIHMLVDAWRRTGNPKDHGRVMDDLRSVVYRGTLGSYFLGSRTVLCAPFDTHDPSLGLSGMVVQTKPTGDRVVFPPRLAQVAGEKPPRSHGFI